MAKTKEELEKLKEDYKNLTAQAKELSEEELENVTGGCSQTYSEETYDSLDIWPDIQNGQRTSYHPLITTALNWCSLRSGGDVCGGCVYRMYLFPTFYCKTRSRELDKGK